MRTSNSSERGQAIVLIALGAIVLLGFTALAIDGGMVFADRRNAQNVADSASLAGAGILALDLENNHLYLQNFTCDQTATAESTAITSALNQAIANGFTTGVDVTTTCVDDGVGVNAKYIDITTTISHTTETSFAQFVFGDSAITSQLMATSRVRPRAPLALGNAVVALNTADCQGQQNGTTFHGTAAIDVDGGGIWTNGCLRGNGSPDVNVYDGSIGYVGQVIGAGLFTNPAPQQATEVIPPDTYAVAPPDCGDPDAHHVRGRDIVGGHTITELDPGLYCITGELRVNGNDSLYGEGVTLYLLDGGLTINGNAYVHITAPSANPDPAPALPGILIMTAPGNNERIQINGNAASIFTGTILAMESDIDFLGTGNANSYHTQVIGNNVQVGGTTDVYISYYANNEYGDPTFIDLQE